MSNSDHLILIKKVLITRISNLEEITLHTYFHGWIVPNKHGVMVTIAYQ